MKRFAYNAVAKASLLDGIMTASSRLLQIARLYSKDYVSSCFSYLLTDISQQSGFDATKRKNNLAKKRPTSLIDTVSKLHSIYADLYELDLVIHRVKPKETIIEIRYYSKSALPKDVLLFEKDNPPILHTRISTPPYFKAEKNETFDLNWQHGGWKHHWNLYWWNKKKNRKRSRG